MRCVGIVVPRFGGKTFEDSSDIAYMLCESIMPDGTIHP